MEKRSMSIQDRDIRPLVQAPMESPLNMAHTYSRKADMLTKSRTYDEAIDCHRRAAEYLLQAMNITKCPTLLDSMALQHKVYLSQIDRLSAKSQLLELVDRTAKTITTVSRATQTDDIHNVDTKQLTTVDEGTVCQILRENDDVMSQISLITDQTPDNNTSTTTSAETYVPSFSFISSATNTPPPLPDLHPLYKSILAQKLGPCPEGSNLHASPDESFSFEAVVKMNARLSSAVRGLITELQASKLEKRQLEQRGDKPRHSQQGILEFSSLDLPPLEVSYPELGNFGS